MSQPVAAANALFQKSMNHIERVRASEEPSERDPKVKDELFVYRPPYHQASHVNANKGLGKLRV